MKNPTKLFFAFLFVTVFSFNATSQVSSFLKFDGVDGEYTDSKHDKWIDVLSWSWGETNSDSKVKSGLGASSIILKVDAASPNLRKGSRLPGGTLRIVNKKMREMLVIKFTDLLISSYQTGGSSGDVVPVDQISLNLSIALKTVNGLSLTMKNSIKES